MTVTNPHAIAFLQTCARRKTVNRRRTSYNWKHVAERAIGVYVSNDEIIQAARVLGIPVRCIRGTPNAWLGISQRAAKIGGAR